jgi:ABC-type maltose transport system permease subunit
MSSAQGSPVIVQTYRRQQQMQMIGRYIVAAFALTFALFPALWVVTASIDPRGSLSQQQLIPPNASLENYTRLLVEEQELIPFGLWLGNSIKIAGIATALSVLVSAMSAYAFSRFRFRLRRGLLLSIFLIQVFPNSLTMVATFLLLQQIGQQVPSFGLNSHGGLILVYLGGAMGVNTWLMKGFFDTVPRELDESARIDGATDWQIFWRIILPLVRPVLVVVGMITFISAYSDFLIPQIVIQDRNQFTLAVGLGLFTRTEFSQNWGLFAAGAVIGAMPIVTIYLLLQEQLVGGLTAGAVKG